ncbi:hypothetical protein BU24DRAFT_405705 [Aaosphaeria arxii CBS 175.79]|uniref:Uncharacterized protein n=1 Tax=Aaosphaeria arxii CBS 175.79 TaxID=1450172 RepID=A0A6A5Y1A7_9PLEO|nr:uncharacterized protein BU24DRAFT_405705 [Aaosphaeria arxii CBS 175.79]KAF2018983.1 hypothetical protein BU24DRAFT_405705 [Aaosphaeria arxii CBS 175.79]
MSERPNPFSLTDTSHSVPRKDRGASLSSSVDRRYFEQVQPIFAVSSSATKLEFVDNSDPRKDLVVRKKAREWVHRNRETTRRNKGAQNAKTQEAGAVTAWDIILSRRASLKDPSSGRIDPFDMLPNVGRKVDHILEFFLTQCPEEVPGSDDALAWRSKAVALAPSRSNTVLGNMADERVSFVLWLHATTTIRDGMAGSLGTEECMYYYKLALQVMREETEKRKVKEFSDAFIAALGCFAACANFAGDFKAALVHRDALLKVLMAKGNGDLLKGIQSTKPWTQKGMAWCEIHVAAQIPATPIIPFNPPAPPKDKIPYSITIETERRTSFTLAQLPPLSLAFPGLISQFHLLCLLQASDKTPPKPPLSGPSLLTNQTIRTSPHAIRPLYCAEYTILQLLSQQKERHDHGFTNTEVVLTEAFQCFLWPALRCLPCEMKLCDLFVTRLKTALITLLDELDLPVDSDIDQAGQSPYLATSSSTPSVLSESSGTSDSDLGTLPILKIYHPTDSLVIWALFIGTLVSSVGGRPEHDWYKDRLLRHILVRNARFIRSKDHLITLLKVFPWTDTFCGTGIKKMHIPF